MMIRQSDVVVTPEVLIGGVFQGVTISADRALSAFVPYLLNEDTGFVQNSTVVDLKAGETDRSYRCCSAWGLSTRKLADSPFERILENMVRTWWI